MPHRSGDELASAAAPPANALLTRAVRRAQWRLIPFLLLMYVLCYLDRANVGYAKQAYQASTGLSDAAFAFGAGIFFVTYALCEVPSNVMLHAVGARVWLGRIMVTWGLLSAAMIFASTKTSFTLLRTLLGAAEAGFFPGSILYLTYWFPARARAKVLGIFYFGSPLAMTLGGPLSGWLLDLQGAFGLEGWQLMFLVEGLMASAIGIGALFYLTDRPTQARWMPAEEREVLSRAVVAEEQRKSREGVVTFGAVFRNIRLFHFALIYFLIQISGYGMAFYLPSQVGALLGRKVGLLVGLVSAIPWACAVVAAYFWPAWAMRSGRRRTFAVLALVSIAIGLGISTKVAPVPAIAALCVATAGIIAAQPIFWTFPTAYFGGIGAAAGIATINALGNLGGVAAPTIKTWLEHHYGSNAIGLYFLGAAAIGAALLVLLLDSPVSSASADGGDAERA